MKLRPPSIDITALSRRDALLAMAGPALVPTLGITLAAQPRRAQAIAPFVIYLGAASITSLTTWLVSRHDSRAADRRQREATEEAARLNRENLSAQQQLTLLQMQAETSRHRDQIAQQRWIQEGAWAAQDRGNMVSMITRLLELDRATGRTDGVVQIGATQARVSVITDTNGVPLNLALSGNADGKGTALDINAGRVVVGRGGYNGALDGNTMRSLAAWQPDTAEPMFVPVDGLHVGVGGRELSKWFDALASDIERSGPIGDRAENYHLVATRPYSRARQPTAGGADHGQALFARRLEGSKVAVGRQVGRALG